MQGPSWGLAFFIVGKIKNARPEPADPKVQVQIDPVLTSYGGGGPGGGPGLGGGGGKSVVSQMKT